MNNENKYALTIKIIDNNTGKNIAAAMRAVEVKVDD